MATYFARKNGNINASDVWATTPSGTAGPQSFAAGDVLVANGFTVTINVSTDLGSTGEIRNDATGGATTGGSFTLNAVTLTANVIAGTAVCVNASAGVGATATITGNITAGVVTNVHGVIQAGAGTLAIIGNVTGGTGSAAYGINANNGTGPVTIVGNVTGNSGGAGIYMASTSGSLTITGNVTANTGIDGILSDQNTANGVTITGNVSGAAAGTAAGFNARSIGTVTLIGACTGGGNGGIGLRNGSTGTMTVVGRAIGGVNTSGGVGLFNASTGVVTVDAIEYGDLGASPTGGPVRFADKTSNVAVMYRFGTSKKTLVDSASSNLLPATNNVRLGTVYNAGQSTGTCAVPPANSVAAGVPVDNATGTATLTAADFWNYLASNINTSGSVGERLVNCSTVSSVSQQLAGAL